MTRRRARLATLCLIAGSPLLLSGCGQGTAQTSSSPSAADPKAQLAAVITQLQDAQRSGFTLGVLGDEAALIASAKAEDSTPPTKEELASLKFLAGLRIVVASDRGKSAATSDDVGSVQVISGGKELATLYGADTEAAVRISPANLVSTLNEINPTEKVSVKQLQSSAPQFDAELPGAGALLKGRWVSVNTSDLQAMGGASAAATPDSASLKKMLTELQSQATVTHAGTDKNHLVLSVPTKSLLTSLQKFTASVPSGSTLAKELDGTGGLTGKDLDGAPASLAVDVLISGTQLVSVQFDARQLEPTVKVAKPFGLQLQVNKDASVVRPDSTPTKLDVSKLPAMASALGGTTH